MPWLLRSYQRVYRIGNWARRRFTLAGQLLLMVMIAAAVFGVNTKQSNTYQLFVLLLCVLIFAMLISRWPRLRVTFERQLPRYGVVGEPLFYRITLHNLTPHSHDRLTLFEQLAEPDPSLAQLRSYRHVTHLPKYRQVISYRHWRQYLTWFRGGTLDNTALPVLTQQPLQLTLSFTPTRRGSISFATSYLCKPDLFGLFHQVVPLLQPQSCLILPKQYPIKPLALSGKRQYQSGGVSLANSVGNSSEFMSLRDYQRGDPLNSIHWKSYAKHGKLIVKEYEDEYFVRRALVLDTSAEQGSEAQFEAAVSVAASIAISEQQTEALLDLMFVGQQAYCFTSGRGVDHVIHLQEILAGIQPSEACAFEQLQHAVLAHLPSCSSLICVLLAWDEERQAFIQQLLAHNMPLAVLLVHEGNVTLDGCANRPEHFYLLDSCHLARDLAAM